ncbi:hypothetical protein J6590_069038 [Homalodisca vitripennis]|nr:hypothetical protein J6590_069038 [Homalodisca vitripennis]
MFKIEQTKTVKPCIVFNNVKYRQHRTLKSGELSWRCLGKSCGASIKTDENITRVTHRNTRAVATTPSTAPPGPNTPRSGSPTASASTPVPDTPPALDTPCTPCTGPVYSTPGQVSVLTVTPSGGLPSGSPDDLIVRASATVDCGIQCELPLDPLLESAPPAVDYGVHHTRHVTGLVRDLTDSATSIGGVCMPGARLLDIIKLNQSSPGPGPRCEVLIAGTNDLVVGAQRNTYRHLEGFIAARQANAEFVVATLPHRYDLYPDLPVHDETVLVNAYIKEQANRYNARVLNLGGSAESSSRGTDNISQ